MSLALRTRRLQRFLNDQFSSGITVDGIYGGETVGALEEALEIEKLTRPAPPPRPRTQFDERTEKNLATLDRAAMPEIRKLVEAAMAFAVVASLEAVVISGNRTWKEQDALYAKGRTAPGDRVTNARGGYSNHNFGLAVDFGIFRDRKYLDGSSKVQEREIAYLAHREIAKLSKELNLNIDWGGDWRSFRDFPHHELRTGLTMKQKRARFLARGTVL